MNSSNFGIIIFAICMTFVAIVGWARFEESREQPSIVFRAISRMWWAMEDGFSALVYKALSLLPGGKRT